MKWRFIFVCVVACRLCFVLGISLHDVIDQFIENFVSFSTFHTFLQYSFHMALDFL